MTNLMPWRKQDYFMTDAFFDDMFNKIFRKSYYDFQNFNYNIREKDDEFIISCVIPGLDVEKLEVVAEHGKINIKYEGLYNDEKETKINSYIKVDDLSLDNDKIKCKYVNGILNIHIPKEAQIQRKIAIEA